MCTLKKISADLYEDLRLGAEHVLKSAIGNIENIIDDVEREAKRRVVYSYSHRIKTKESLEEKCSRRGLKPSEIEDIAGIKIIVLFQDDIQAICDVLENNFAVRCKDDYIKHPKDSGYQAVHLTIVVKTTVNREQRMVPVEIQIKSLLTDAIWSIEHVVNYKNDSPDPRANDILKNAAKRISELEKRIIEFRDYSSKNPPV